MPALELLNPYCTLAALVQELKQNLDDVNNNASLKDELTAAINNASRWVDDYKQRDYFKHDYSTTALEIDQYFRGLVDDTIFLKWPVLALTEVTETGIVLVLNTDYAVADDGYTLRRLGRGKKWTAERPKSLVTLKGTFGYAQATTADIPTGIPDQISYATRLVAAAMSGHNRKETVGLDGQKTDVIQTEIPKTVYQLLGRKKPLLL